MAALYTRIACETFNHTPRPLLLSPLGRKRLNSALTDCECALQSNRDQASVKGSGRTKAKPTDAFRGTQCQQRNHSEANQGRNRDDLGDLLIGVKACILVIISRQRDSGVAVDPLLVNASTLASLAATAARRLRVQHATTDLDEDGFWSALEHALIAFGGNATPPLDFFFDARLARFDLGDQRALLVVHATHDVLQNIRTYTRATRVSVRLFLTGSHLVLTVTESISIRLQV